MASRMRWLVNASAQLALTGVTVQPDDGLKGLRRYVPRRPEVGQGGAMNGEVLGNLLFVRRRT
jgi:hypothetical protein